MWFVLDAPRSGVKPAMRQGPYTRATIVEMLAQGQLEGGKLIWTNERIFPNAAKPRSGRLIRILDWLRLDQFPDPVYRKLQAEASMFIKGYDVIPGVLPAPAPDSTVPSASYDSYPSPPSSPYAPQPQGVVPPPVPPSGHPYAPAPAYQPQPAAYPSPHPVPPTHPPLLNPWPAPNPYAPQPHPSPYAQPPPQPYPYPSGYPSPHVPYPHH